ncbi:hypothetical protein AX16_008336 [Volvariella volvacea WC 439]|nr:hypothetical protein AX16_008336 [Volvariella volvacea WC 439]
MDQKALVGILVDSVDCFRELARVKLRLLLLSALGLLASVFGISSTRIVDKFIELETPIAKAGILANIGPDGLKSWGAKAGVVVASPSNVFPNYVYTWTRDSSLVFKLLVDQYTHGEDTSTSSRTLIDSFVASQARIQHISSPSGSRLTGGLGEPKFHVDETAFTGSWGRPQRDGPPLRATTFITYANWLLEHSNSSYVVNMLWPVIKLDLDYTAQYWNYTGFDLWEEISSSSFFTTASQHRALRQGSILARKLGQIALASIYENQADNLLCFLQTYWNPSAGYITSNTGGGRSGKDANSVLASIHNFDVEAGCDPITFQPCSDRALSNLKVYVDAFRFLYPINFGSTVNAAIATGRYPEDVYFGGHPWYLTTAAAAEQLYDALIVWDRLGALDVTDISLLFFRQFLPSVKVGTYPSSSNTYRVITASMKNFADGFLIIIRKYTPADGSLAEQYHRLTGNPISAKDLTWSYAAILTAFAARRGVTSASWGAKGLAVPSVCGNGPHVEVTFSVYATTIWGENIYLTGNVGALNNWSPYYALQLSANDYPTWSITLRMPAYTKIEYKYLRKYAGITTWESDPNRSFTTPGNGSWVLDDSWR